MSGLTCRTGFAALYVVATSLIAGVFMVITLLMFLPAGGNSLLDDALAAVLAPVLGGVLLAGPAAIALDRRMAAGKPGGWWLVPAAMAAAGAVVAVGWKWLAGWNSGDYSDLPLALVLLALMYFVPAGLIVYFLLKRLWTVLSGQTAPCATVEEGMPR